MHLLKCFNKPVLISLFAICALTLALRIIYPYQAVFGWGYVSFLETDAYNRMDYARQIAVLLGNSPWQAFLFTVQNSLLFSFTIALLSKLGNIEVIGAWLPPIIGVGVVLVVYGIGSRLFNHHVGLLAALFAAIIPSEFLHRSLLGFADHHTLEILLLVLTVWLLIMALDKPRILNRYTFLAGASSFLYMANWASGLYLLTGVLVVFTATLIWHNIKYEKPWHNSVGVVGLLLVVGLALYLPLGGYVRLLWLLPGAAATTPVQTTVEIVTTLLARPSTRTISELMPLFSPFGTFSLGVVITNLHLFALTFLIGLPFLWKYRADRGVLLVAIWTLIMLAITLNQRRFMYYFTINVALVSALALYEVSKYMKGKVMSTAIILAIPLLLISMPLARNIGSVRAFQMTPEWHNALTWLKAQPDTGNVTAWSDYGHWIKYVSGKTPNYLPGPGGELAAQLFLTTDTKQARELLKQLDTGYLIIDKDTLARKYYALVVYAGFEPPDRHDALAYRLYDNRLPQFLVLAYESENIRIFTP